MGQSACASKAEGRREGAVRSLQGKGALAEITSLDNRVRDSEALIVQRFSFVDCLLEQRVCLTDVHQSKYSRE